MHRIPGWLSIVDAVVLEDLDASQQADGIFGDIVEIGVYAGRSAVLLGHLRRDHERLWLCDTFDRPSDEPDHVGTAFYRPVSVERFLATWDRHHRWRPEIVAGPSHELAARVEPGSARLVHVDGGHDFEIVARDLGVAAVSLRRGGVVVADDWRTAHSPGVGAAVWRAVLETGLIPIAVTDAKLYGSWSTTSDAFSARLADDPRLAVRWHRIAGTDVAQVAATPGMRARRLVGLPWSVLRRVLR